MRSWSRLAAPVRSVLEQAVRTVSVRRGPDVPERLLNSFLASGAPDLPDDDVLALLRSLAALERTDRLASGSVRSFVRGRRTLHLRPLFDRSDPSQLLVAVVSGPDVVHARGAEVVLGLLGADGAQVVPYALVHPSGGVVTTSVRSGTRREHVTASGRVLCVLQRPGRMSNSWEVLAPDGHVVSEDLSLVDYRPPSLRSDDDGAALLVARLLAR